MNTYLIANGGCGERLASVMLMLYQCGFYGTADPIKGVLVIDNDRKNHSLIHLRNIVEAVNNMNEALGRDDIPPIEAVAWAPEIISGESLHYLLSSVSEYEAVCLISTADEMQQRINEKGYAGHANIGAVYINTIFEEDRNSNSRRFCDFLSEACPKQSEEEARFIIMGSTHGGTGASLNTAIAKKIRSYYKESTAKIDIFGLFMQSYYTIPPMGKHAVDNNIHIDPEQFRPSDIEALETYRDMHLIDEENPVFDNILFCGFSPRPPINLEHQEGGDPQENRFSIPELIMCAGANCIFEGNTVRNQYLAIDLGNFDGTIRWRNIPYGMELKKCIEGMGLFACSITEENKDAAWNNLLRKRVGNFINYFYYITPVHMTDEFPLFLASRNRVLFFVELFWNMLYQITTNVNGSWNENVALLKKDAFEEKPRPQGFDWIDDVMSDATIVNNDGETFTGENVPSMFSFCNVFKRVSIRNKIGFIRTYSDVYVRVEAYFKALLDASYATYEEVEN